jgi:hypothetical protein
VTLGVSPITSTVRFSPSAYETPLPNNNNPSREENTLMSN